MPSRSARVLCGCVLALTLASACAPSAAAPTRDVRLAPAQTGSQATARVNQFELQEDVQRYTGDLLTRMGGAIESLSTDEPSPAVRQRLLSFSLDTSSAVLDVASGPLPEINVLDMVVLVSLTRSVIERYWLPAVFGDRGAPLLAAFETSEVEVWELASKILTADQRRYVVSLIETFKVQNPDTVRVQLLRFQEFSELAGQVREDERQATRGLLGSVRAATQTADHALMLSERAVFLAQRMPFLLRLQSRLGSQEIIDDSVQRFTSHEFFAKLPRPGPLLGELRALSGESRESVRELNLLLGSVKPLVTSGELKGTLDAAHDLTSEGLALVRELRELEPRYAVQAATELENRAARFTDRLLVKICLLGAAWILLFWGGYYVAKRFTRKLPDSGSSDHLGPGRPGLGHA